ncbi:ribonuclease P protein component [Robertkochia marina]|uniref:Ribonuclease P protein component n=1 Tax=Robertkochia marina TaxID=1227945 RepID=A0A4V3UYD3_9FLAO|nr:ribonuclease P protein component [Robertkochia marina]THD69298.1 ribonuclease P protein component [Robertkochia marina]TRZ47444.1 ribonuclease P protein component [Robertkochia marina]
MDRSFPRKEKLKSRKLIEAVFTEGSSVSAYPLKLVYLPAELPEEVPVQAAVSVPKRRFKRAVDRNRIKRLMRESWRLQKWEWLPQLQKSYAFVFIYTGRDLPEQQQLNKKMAQLFQKFLKNNVNI